MARGIVFLELSPGLLKSLKILSLKSKILCQTPFKIGSAMAAVMDPIQFLMFFVTGARLLVTLYILLKDEKAYFLSEKNI